MNQEFEPIYPVLFRESSVPPHWEVTVKVDTNDADYVSATFRISEEDKLRLRKLLVDVKANIGQYRTHESVWDSENEKKKVYTHWSEEDFDFLERFIPDTPHGILSIDQVTFRLIKEINNETLIFC